MNRSIVFAVCAVISAAACAVIGCSRPVMRYPSCGAYHQRLTDGAVCRECIDAQGSYAECGMRVLRKP